MTRKVSYAAIVAVFYAWFLLPGVFAQAVPGGATTGGALPDLSDQRVPPSPESENLVVPPLLERLEQDTDEGPRVRVSEFKLVANRRGENRWRGGEHIATIESALASAVSEQPGNGFTLGQIGEILETIQSQLRDDGMMLAQLFLPVQTIANNVVAVQLLEGRVGAIVTEGNTRYTDKLLKKPLNDLVGSAVDTDDVEEAILLLRDYPGIAVAGVFSPGDEVGSTNLILSVNEEDPFDFTLSGDNHGSEFTGETRALAVFGFNNLLGDADRLTLSLLQTLDPANGTYGAIDLVEPIFSSGNYLRLGYVQNSFEIGRQGSALAAAELEGDTSITTIGISRSLRRSRDRNLMADLSLILKDATVEDVTSNVVTGEDQLTTLELGLNYDGVDRRFRGYNSGYLGVVTGLPDVFGSLDDTEFGVDRGSSRRLDSNTSAGGDFTKWVGRLTRLQQLTDNTQLLIRTNAQFSDDLLVSLEQFSLGGPNSVRAYPPAEFLVDTGGFVSAEYIVAAPGFANKEAFGGFTWGEVLSFSLFYDYAGGYVSDIAFGEEKTRDISGYGLGIDFRLPGKFRTRLDLAKAAGDEEPSDGDDPQLYFSINYSF